MFHNGNWVPIRRGILDHFNEGHLTATEYLVLVTIILLADKARGVWRGSSPALVAISGQQLSHSYVKVAMKSLADKGYIATDYVPGARANFNILVNRYQCTTGEHKNKRVNLDKSQVGPGVMQPYYESAFEDDGEIETTPDVAPDAALDSAPDGGPDRAPVAAPETAPYSIPSIPDKTSQYLKTTIPTKKAAGASAAPEKRSMKTGFIDEED